MQASTGVNGAKLKNNTFLLYFTNAFVNIKRSNINNNNIHSNSIVESCLDLNAKDANGATLMHIASANGYHTILDFLLNECQIGAESGAPLIAPSLASRDNDGWTPLHVATFWGHQKAIEILLENGADTDLRTHNDETVLELCDDPDVRDFIILKSKEMEDSQHREKQAKARAAAALQIKLQIINNSSSLRQSNSAQNNTTNNGSNGSIRSVATAEKSNSYNNVNNGNISNSNSSNNNILTSINNSTRSLKRTSTGVSRR